MTVKSACGGMVVMVIVIAVLGAVVMHLMELNVFLFVGIPFVSGAIAIALIMQARAAAVKAEAVAEQERTDTALALKETNANLTAATEAGKKQATESVAAIAVLEADLSELVSLMQAVLAGDFVTAKRVRLRSEHNKNAAEFASGMAEVNVELRGAATALSSGDLRRAVNADKLKGEWNKLAQDLNRGLADAAAVTAQAKTACDSFAQGILSGRVEADARGDLQALKAAVNNASANLSKYVANVGETIKHESTRGRGFVELPGDFAYLKSAITAAMGATTVPTTPIRTAAASNLPATRTSGARAVADSGSRFSGAARVNDSSRSTAFEFDRKDFGKY